VSDGRFGVLEADGRFSFLPDGPATQQQRVEVSRQSLS
jgi:hypothetical protein